MAAEETAAGGVAALIDPVVGSARVVSAARAIGDAFGLELPEDEER
ncbi:hypothetical protein [Streptomyces sp. NBC_00878]|nr:hypothetical protein [Streptomyces sp. NBC_00878]MCX4906335.1 hypothetical protein [Streptomyces sp. NBC_00878]